VASKRTEIAQAIASIITTNLVPDSIKTVITDKVRLLAEDFQDWELPAVQIIDLGEVNQHEIRRGKKSWNLSIEVVIGPTAEDPVSQEELWDLMELLETTIWPTPQLGLSYVIHAKLLGSSTDLHLLDPFYTGRIDLVVDYYQPLVGNC